MKHDLGLLVRLHMKAKNSKNNGGKTDYYKIKKKWKTAQDIVEAKKMNYAQGNVLKVAITFNTGRHSGTDYERDLNKAIYFLNRELKKEIKRKKKAKKGRR